MSMRQVIVVAAMVACLVAGLAVVLTSATGFANVGLPPMAGSANGAASSPSRRIGVSHPRGDLTRLRSSPQSIR